MEIFKALSYYRFLPKRLDSLEAVTIIAKLHKARNTGVIPVLLLS